MNIDSVSQANNHQIQELESNVDDLLHQLQLLKEENNRKSMQISEMGKKISDLKVEKTAYRETLTNLNQELARLTNEEQSHRTEIFTLNASFKKQLNDIISQDNEKIEKLTGDYDDVSKSRERLQMDLDESNKKHEQEVNLLKADIERLGKQIVTSEKSYAETNSSSMEKGEKFETIPLAEDPGRENQISAYTQTLQDRIFDIISTNIFILENIGLLLTFDNNNNIQIRRVKGLKKGTAQSNILDESTQMLDAHDNSLIKKSGFPEIER